MNGPRGRDAVQSQETSRGDSARSPIHTSSSGANGCDLARGRCARNRVGFRQRPMSNNRYTAAEKQRRQRGLSRLQGLDSERN